MSQYEQLMKELGGIPLAKALPADDGNGDAKIQAAAEDGGEGVPAKKKEGDEDCEKPPMTKSLQVTLADGSVVDAEDGTELVKSLIARIDQNETDSVTVMGQAIGLIKSQATAITEQGALIKSLQGDVAKLGNEGRGRKTMVSLIEKQGPADMAKSEPQGMSGQEFLTKSSAAFAGGKISGQELTVIDVSLRQGAAIDPALIAKVVA